MDQACPICSDPDADMQVRGDAREVRCPRCGNFSISETAASAWAARGSSPRTIANASGWLREHPGVALSSRDVAALAAVAIPPFTVRAASLMLAFEADASALGKPITIMTRRVRRADAAGPLRPFPEGGYAEDYFLPKWLALSWASDVAEFWYLAMTYLGRELGYLTWEGFAEQGRDDAYEVAITPKGYAYLEGLRKTRPDSQIGFCAMWFDASVREVWIRGIEPAIRSAGYHAVRLDQHEHNEPIDDEIIAMIRRSRFVVADATGSSNGVYFEAGFAKGLDLPVIWTVREDALESVHFDTRQFNFVTWRAEALDDFSRRLQNRIEATLGRGTYTAAAVPLQPQAIAAADAAKRESPD